MIKKSFILMLTGIIINMSFPFLSAAASGSLTDTHTHTNTLELKPAPLDKSFQMASVCFMGFGDCDPNMDYHIDTPNQCIQEGFTKLNCNSVQEPDRLCSYNSAYGKGCKCKPGLISCPAGQVGVGDSCGGKYATCKCDPALVSCPSNKNGQGASCGGKYQSCVCKPEYKYTSSNCSYPRYTYGSTCDGKYTGCTCPSAASCSYGCASYYASPCGSVCASCKTNPDCDVASQNCSYGCASYNSCSKCTSCKSNPDCSVTSQSCPYGCASTNSCNKCTACKSNPDCNVTSQSCSYGCASTNSCGKCTSCKGNPCDSVTAVSVPANASCSSHFSTCASKCSAWNCNSGYTKSGNSCVLAAKCSDGGYLSSNPSNNTCERTTYQGLTCYKNCKRPVNIYEAWPDGSNICSGGPYIAPGYKGSSDKYYTTFPRSECISPTMDKTSLTIPLGSSVRINIQDHMGHTLCTIARRTPAFPYSRIACDRYKECIFNVENSESYSDYMDIYVVYRKSNEHSSYVNGSYISCDY